MTDPQPNQPQETTLQILVRAFPSSWLSENVDELGALITLITGIYIIYNSFTYGVAPGTETFVELFKYLTTSAIIYLFGKHSS